MRTTDRCPFELLVVKLVSGVGMPVLETKTLSKKTIKTRGEKKLT